MATQFAQHPSASIPEACGNWKMAKGADRFFDPEAVEPQALLAAHQPATLERMKAQSWVLVAQDTTSFNYSSHPHTQGLGPIGDEGDGPQGLLMHPALALSEGGEPLGVIFARFWARDPEDFHKAQKRYERTLEEKERVKWLEGWRATEAAARQMPRPEDQPTRPAVLEVRFCELTLQPPKRKPHLPALRVYGVEAREIPPPERGQTDLLAIVEHVAGEHRPGSGPVCEVVCQTMADRGVS